MITQPMVIYAGVSAAAALFVSAVLTAFLCWLAPKINLLDHPDARRKLHARPTPLGGGVAIFLALCFVLAANFLLPNPWGFHIQRDWNDLLVLLLASGWLVGVGLYDDRFNLRGRYKLLAQVLAAVLVVGGGYSFDRADIFGVSVTLGDFGPLIAVIWFLGTINSINLLDGMDGQAGTLGVIFSVTIALMACLTGHFAVAFIAIVLAAAILGFLIFNLPPAKIFLGDAGSMFIGLILGVLAVRASIKGPSTLMVATVLLLWSLPMLDTAAAIVRRKLSRRSIYSTDRFHLHHQFIEKLGNNTRALLLVTVLAFSMACAAVATLVVGNDLLAVGCGTTMLVGLVATGLFGRAECRLIWAALRKVGRRLKRAFSRQNDCVCEGLQLSGRGTWQHLWEQLTQPASQYNLVYARIDLNDSHLRENYVGEWQRSGLPADLHQQPLSHHVIPLWVHNREVGKIEAVILRQGETFQRDVEFVLSLADPFEARLYELAGTHGVGFSTQSQSTTIPTHIVKRVDGAAHEWTGGGNGNGHTRKQVLHNPPQPATSPQFHLKQEVSH
ncbi:MAG: undecaprenyl/decaprenyl-phosphate alpha-N-acetylglucosaminyl 1-phosphate transferase [Thermogutta sp.]|uniref:MraY family glycosyltransferase n=1 Tax=Thermogutta sp. TaxID=1962930 RepID=UPI0019B570A8|nr:MraY family glycosyltransferase [Thermogutta sp.]MBC7352218.1 undecaprenyl/decaprenyl-phosphate alpha-N-acetylglucosaminyl 1-phosphate transferase [Thermogutta sp.]